MVYITGDIHGDAGPVYQLFERFNPEPEDIIVLLGDVGLTTRGNWQTGI